MERIWHDWFALAIVRKINSLEDKETEMKNFSVALMALLFAGAVTYAAAPKSSVKSGLQVGESAPPYFVNDITGPNAGKTLCYRCKFGGRPVVNIFTREMTPEVADLIAQIDKKVAANRSNKMAAFVVHITDDVDASETTLKKVAQTKHLDKTPLTNFDGTAGPSNYKIAKNADVTVMMWVRGKVKVNHAFNSAKLSKDSIKQIVADTSKILN